jgi:hypothetical protein
LLSGGSRTLSERTFAFLARLPQDGNVKLRTLAERLIAATTGRDGR